MKQVRGDLELRENINLAFGHDSGHCIVPSVNVVLKENFS